MAKRLQLTALDLQDESRIREVVAATLLENMDTLDFEVGPKADRAVRRVKSHLTDFLKRMGTPNPEKESGAIVDDVLVMIAMAAMSTASEKR